MWQPWSKSTGPTTLEGKAVVSRNAWQGGQRARLRQLSKMVNEELRQSQERNSGLNACNGSPRHP